MKFCPYCEEDGPLDATGDCSRCREQHELITTVAYLATTVEPYAATAEHRRKARAFLGVAITGQRVPKWARATYEWAHAVVGVGGSREEQVPVRDIAVECLPHDPPLSVGLTYHPPPPSGGPASYQAYLDGTPLAEYGWDEADAIDELARSLHHWAERTLEDPRVWNERLSKEDAVLAAKVLRLAQAGHLEAELRAAAPDAVLDEGYELPRPAG